MSSAHHPEIGSLIRKRDAIDEKLAEGRYIDAIHAMIRLLLELKPDDIRSDTGKELLNDLYSELNYIREIHQKDPGVVPTLTFNNADNYIGFYSRLNSILWEKGYLLDSSYGFWDPSGGRKSGASFNAKTS